MVFSKLQDKLMERFFNPTGMGLDLCWVCIIRYFQKNFEKFSTIEDVNDVCQFLIYTLFCFHCEDILTVYRVAYFYRRWHGNKPETDYCLNEDKMFFLQPLFTEREQIHPPNAVFCNEEFMELTLLSVDTCFALLLNKFGMDRYSLWLENTTKAKANSVTTFL